MTTASPFADPGRSMDGMDDFENAVAVIGLACRFPGASDARAFWEMLERGDDGLIVAPSNDTLRRACFSMPDRFEFDAKFFGISPAQARVMDPQHRIFLQCAWHALEDAGYGRREVDDLTGLFAACGFNDYVLRHVGMRDFHDSAAEAFDVILGNDKDYLATRTAHLLNLTGPVVVCQSACSSGLLCVHQAVQSLLQFETQMALAGAASVSVSLEDGYRSDPGGVMSDQAKIMPFHADADGIVGGNGAAVVVLKRLQDARRDGDHIYASIRGSAAGNDGAMRASFTAPSVAGQRRVLQDALSLSGLAADDVTYIEAHGTGTPLGDPIEMQAIRDVYGAGNTPAMVGSVKGNTGHLNAAAGLAGLIKAVGVLDRQITPATLHLTSPNPALELDDTRFVLSPGELPDTPVKAAAVSSFGFGGTNVHVVLQRETSTNSQGLNNPQIQPINIGVSQVLQLSTRTETALADSAKNLAAVLNTDCPPLQHVAHTLATGRSSLPLRHAVVAKDSMQAAARLTTDQVIQPSSRQGTVFVLPGQGMQFAGMGEILYHRCSSVQARIDEISEYVVALGGEDPRPVLFGTHDTALQRTDRTQLGLFAVEYALGEWLGGGGIVPQALLGHSVGEITAAALAGVFTCNDATRLIYERGRLIAQLPQAGMVSIRASEQNVRDILPKEADIAVVNGPDLVAVSGVTPVLDDVIDRATKRGWGAQRLPVSHGFHSRLLDPALDAFNDVLESLNFSTPQLPILSNMSGDFAKPDELQTPQYWVRHMRDTVRFGDNVALAKQKHPMAQMLVVGPGALSGMVPLMRSRETQDEDIAAGLAQLWVDHEPVDKLLQDLRGASHQRVPLPGYPFEKKEYIARFSAGVKQATGAIKSYQTYWRRQSQTASPKTSGRILWFGPGHEKQSDIINVSIGPKFEKVSGSVFRVASCNAGDIDRLFDELAGDAITQIVVAIDAEPPEAACWLLHRLKDRAPVLTLLSLSCASVVGDEAQHPKQAIAQGWLQSLAFRCGTSKLVCLDVDELPDSIMLQRVNALRQKSVTAQCLFLALRNGNLWSQEFADADLPLTSRTDVIRHGGCYLIVGGLGVLGRALLAEIANDVGRVVLVSRNPTNDLVNNPSHDPQLKGYVDQGLKIEICAADVGELSDLSTLAADLAARGVTIAGIFNLAGDYGSGTTDPQNVQSGKNLRAKAVGSENLASAFADHDLDFIAVFTSMAGETSGVGITDYVTASLAVKALAEADPGTIRAIAWDTWDRVGGNSDLSEVAGAITDGQLLIDKATGFAQLWSILASGLPYCVVSSQPVESRQTAVADAVLAQRTPKTPSITHAGQDDDPVVQMVQLLIGDVLGIQQVQPNDDFLTIGGDSLSGVRLVSRLKKLFGVEITLADFMIARTPLALAHWLGDSADLNRRAETFVRFQTMPDAEREKLRQSLQPA